MGQLKQKYTMIIYILPYSVEDISRHEYTMAKLNGDGIERTIFLFSTRFTVEKNTDQRILDIKNDWVQIRECPIISGATVPWQYDQFVRLH